MLRQFLACGLAIPFLVGLGLDFALNEELSKLAPLRFTFERHFSSYFGSISRWGDSEDAVITDPSRRG